MTKLLFSSLLIVLTLSLTLFSCAPGPTEYGVLRGHVEIGPLVPVVQPGEEPPTPSPEVYAAREVVVYGSNGEREIQRIQIDGQGNYITELPAGIYVVDINRIGIDRADGLPQQIKIRPQETTELDIAIDTGIR